MDTETDAEVINLCQSAFHAEYYRQSHRAYELHGEAIQALNRLIKDTGFFDRDRKRTAKNQLKFHTTRQQLLRPLRDGTQTRLPIILPTSVSAQGELLTRRNNGLMPISSDELWLANFLKDKETNPYLAPDLAMQHLLRKPVPFYMPTLDPRLPPYSYKVSVSYEHTFIQRIMRFKAKSASGNDDTPGNEPQTLYVLQTRSWPRDKVPLMTFHRSSEFATPCTRIAVTGTGPGLTNYDILAKGRPMGLYTSSPRAIQEQPERWDSPTRVSRRFMYRFTYPRRFVYRFTYGGRQFAWVPEHNDMSLPPSLYEIEGAWPKPGSKTGKMLYKVVGSKLAWAERILSLKTRCVLHIAGGTDQLFREYILASQLTRIAIGFHGLDY